jgi:diguanylate cyclase (GGDEF)-like protein/PAS domain S-box-containing protein
MSRLLVTGSHASMDAAITPKLPPLEDVLDLVPDVVCVVDPDGRYLFVSSAFERIFGYARQEVLGRRMIELVHPEDRQATLHAADRIMEGALQRHFRNRYVRKDGEVIDIQWSARWLPEYGVRIAVGHEVTELRRAERELEYLSMHDALTGLPNRLHARRALELAIEEATRSGEGLSVLYLDLDDFKVANDRGGHEAGDRLLQEVGQRLQRGLRQGDLVARVGGDEFVAILPGCPDAATAAGIAGHLRDNLRRPYALAGEEFRLDASVGVACFPGDGRAPEELLRHADLAMYAAKRASGAQPA